MVSCRLLLLVLLSAATKLSAQIELYYTPLYSDPSLISYWRFEGNSNDSKSTNNGTDTNVIYSASNGKFGQGASFAGSSSKSEVVLPDASNLRPVSALTVSYWIKVPSGGTQEPFSDYNNLSGNKFGYGFEIEDNGTIEFLIEHDSPDDYQISSSASICDGLWHLITGVWDGSYIYLYIDGVSAVTNVSAPSINYASNQYATIGSVGYGAGIYGEYLNGDMDDLAVFSRALTTTEISNLYTGNWPPPTLTVHEYPVTSAPFSSLQGITTGPDGALWFTEYGGSPPTTSKIGTITTAGVITEYPLPLGSGPQGITTGPDGALWFAESLANQIGRITTAGAITTYPVPTGPDARPVGITAGPDGALWFTEYLANQIGRITTAGGITEYPMLTSNSGPIEITAGPDGALWFTEETANQIGRITTAEAITEYPVPTENSGLGPIAAGPDGALWFTEYNANQIGRVTTTGAVTEYPVPTPNSMPDGITAGPDGALWFMEYGANQIGRITTAEAITEYPVPIASSGPHEITTGPDGALWFTQYLSNNIGQAVLSFPQPSLQATPSSLTFSYQQGVAGPPSPQNVTISSTGAALNFTAGASTTPAGTWLSVSPTTGTTGTPTGTLVISVIPQGLALGTYNGQITITAAGAANSPLSIPVTLTVTPASCFQPVRPVPNVVTLKFGAKPTYAKGLLHNGTDYASALANTIGSVGPGGFIFDASTDGYTKATSAEFGSIDPNGKGPTIWVRYTLSTGAPVYVLYGHTAACPAPPCWNDQSTGSGKTFQFNCTYTVDWHTNDPVGIGTIIGYTAPYYLYGEPHDHLHIGVFVPNKSCKNGTSYCEPPTSYWGYAPGMTFPGGTYIDPQLFFSDSEYCLAQ